MSLPLTAPECFAVAIIVFALIGLQRGWRREVISLAFVGVGLLFLVTLKGGQGLANFLFLRVPVIMADIFGQAAPKTSGPSQQAVQLTTLVAFFVILALGYLIGNKAMSKAATPAEHIWGVVPALFTGFAVVFFINSFISQNQGGNSLFTFAFEAPDPTRYIVVIFVIAVVVVVIALVAASVKKSGGAKK